MRLVDVATWMDEMGIEDQEERREMIALVQGLDMHARKEPKPSG